MLYQISGNNKGDEMGALSRRNFLVGTSAIAVGAVLGLTGCGSPENEDVASTATNSFTPGSYKASGNGKYGRVEIEVTFDDAAIIGIDPVSHDESPGVGDVAIDRLSHEVLERQTLAIDTVSGATLTSMAFISALEDSVMQAGGDVDAMKNAPNEGEPKEEIELTIDVVVLGSGATGLCAAISANENGATVILFEKLGIIGGSTAFSGGALAGAGTRFQKELGIEDDKETYMAQWRTAQASSMEGGMYPDYDLLDNFMTEGPKTIEWVVDYAGHDIVHVFSDGWGERLHWPVEAGLDTVSMFDYRTFIGGRHYVNHLEDCARSKSGIEIILETPVRELIVNDSGDVLGVIAESKDRIYTVNAKKVILGAGGYGSNKEMLAKYIPGSERGWGVGLSCVGNTGDGMVMAEKIGAVRYEQPTVSGTGVGTKINNVGANNRSLYVDGKGERFINESLMSSPRLAKQNGICWVVIDSAEGNAKTIEALEMAIPTEEAVKGSTLEELAQAMNVPVETFVATVETYNEGVATGVDALGKSPERMIAVETTPYYAYQIYPSWLLTMAGVKVNKNYQVLREDGSIINNLYAGGECSNRGLYNQTYFSGTSVGYGSTSGRVAGLHAAQNL
jgi:fumarate reductase flavoprotein subunit